MTDEQALPNTPVVDPRPGEELFWKGNPNDSEWYYGTVIARLDDYVWMLPRMKSRAFLPFSVILQPKKKIPLTLPVKRLRYEPDPRIGNS
jgi:hypothetical protein